MGYVNKIHLSGSIGLMSLRSTVQVDSGAVAQVSEMIPAAKTGTLSARTDDDTGTLTMQAGHGIPTGAKVDIYWTGGRRYNVTVGTVAGNSVPFDLGDGDDLPSLNSSVTVCVQQVFAISTGGKDSQAFAVSLAARGRAEFRESSDSPNVFVDLVAKRVELYSQAQAFSVTGGVDFTVVTKVAVTQAGATEAKFECAAAYDAGP